jgi:hypothetical protein
LICCHGDIKEATMKGYCFHKKCFLFREVI